MSCLSPLSTQNSWHSLQFISFAEQIEITAFGLAYFTAGGNSEIESTTQYNGKRIRKIFAYAFSKPQQNTINYTALPKPFIWFLQL